MPDNFCNDSLLELYLYESTMLLDSLDGILLNAESEHNLTKGNINEIFRIMHTIKGSSAMMAYPGISEVAHKTEDLFSVVRDNGLDNDIFDELFNIVLTVSDFLKAEVAKVQDGAQPETEVTALTKAVCGLAETLHEKAGSVPKPDLGRMLGASAPMAIPFRKPLAAAASAAIPFRKPEPAGESLPEPAGTSPPEPIKLPVPRKLLPEDLMPIAPEGGRILGLNPSDVPARNGQAKEDASEKPDELRADLSKVAGHVAGGSNVLAEPIAYYLHIHFNEGAKMENIRAFMLVNKLNEKGTVSQTFPGNLESNPSASAQIVERGLYVSFTTTLFREQIENLAKGTLSVETVSFVRKMPDGSNARTATTETPKPEPRPQPVRLPEPVRDGTPRESTEAMLTDSPAQIQSPKKAEPELGIPTRDESHQRTQDSPKPDAAQPVPDSPTTEASTQNAMPSLESPVPHAQNFISVDLKKLDTLLDLVGEIVINETIVAENQDLRGLELPNFVRASRQLGKLTDELQDTVMSIRMLPVSNVFQRMRRIVRDMGKSLGKDPDLVLIGESTEMDKNILDALADPLMHLVRNAMDHGMEPASERAAAGKNPVGHIYLAAQNSGGDVIISVSDDGRGLNRDAILEKARAKGLLRKPESEYGSRETFALLMAPGFSTKDEITEYSGRGVGLDVVKSNIEKIGGSVIIESKLGVGTHIILKIPLTLAIVSCMEVEVAGDLYSIPVSNVREAFKADAAQVVTDPLGLEMVLLRGAAYPVIRLHERFGRANAVTDVHEGILVLAEAGDKSVCLLADTLIGKSQVVVKPLPAYLNRFNRRRSGISGCTIMGDGNISLIVNVPNLVV